MENRFNLVDEAWIPVADAGRVSLRQLFTNPDYRALGGNPVQKLALMKFLLAIAQAAVTPKDEHEWRNLGAQGLAEACLRYLDKWHDRFWLYGERPFLQVPAVREVIKIRTEKKLATVKIPSKKKEVLLSGEEKEVGAGFYPDLPSGNNTVLSHTMMNKTISDAEKAVFIISLMNFSLAGKRVEADLVSLSGAELGNKYSAPAGPSQGGWNGLLHAFMTSDSVVESIWVNLLTRDDISSLNRWPTGLGTPPWESMPKAENDERSLNHRGSYQASLIALSRFAVLHNEGVYYLDGIKYPSVKDGWYEASLILNFTSEAIKAKYVDPEKRPWRELQSFLAFVGGVSSDFECFNLRKAFDRLRGEKEKYTIWCAGLKVTSNSGDQSVKQSDDFVESHVILYDEYVGESWFSQLKIEMSSLDSLSSLLWSKVFSYFKDLKADNGKKKENTQAGKISKVATHQFWQLCERDFQALVDGCEQPDIRHRLRRRFADYVHQAFDRYCPRDTARQLDAWAKNRPNLSNYLKQEG